MPSRKMGIVVAGVVVVLVGAAALAFGRGGPSEVAGAASHAAGAQERATLDKTAARFRILAHTVIMRRNALARQRGDVTRLDALAVAAVRDIAFEMAAINGEANPTRGEAFASTRGSAESVVSGDIVNTDQPVFVAVFDGNFVGYGASSPTGRLPVGNVMTITFDAKTLAVTDWGIVSVRPDTAPLGVATPLFP
ncbi:MAG: hypothetical protein ACXWC3_19010 [Burkholderiales bacterium]